jgi:hypothetical protein
MKNLLLFLALFTFACSDGGGTMPGNGTPRPTPAPNNGTLSVNSTAPVSEETKTLMKKALDELFEDAKVKGYTKYTSYSNYIYVIRQDCQLINNTMSWQQETPGYGLIWQAERVQIKPTATVQTVQICNDIPEHMYNTTRYGAEHVILYFNNQTEFKRTEIHSDACNCPHPIITRNNSQ